MLSPLLGSAPAPARMFDFSTDRMTLSLLALIDSGSSITCIPYNLITGLSLVPIGSGPVDTARSLFSKETDIYRVNIDFFGVIFRNFPVYRFEKDFALIGRDILNKYYLQLNGPTMNFHCDATVG